MHVHCREIASPLSAHIVINAELKLLKPSPPSESGAIPIFTSERSKKVRANALWTTFVRSRQSIPPCIVSINFCDTRDRLTIRAHDSSLARKYVLRCSPETAQLVKIALEIRVDEVQLDVLVMHLPTLFVEIKTDVFDELISSLVDRRTIGLHHPCLLASLFGEINDNLSTVETNLRVEMQLHRD